MATTTTTEKATYTFGHHTSVVSSHARRTAQDSLAFLLPHLQPHHTILDVGCGPGSITADLAQLVPHGHVTGVDAAESVLATARAHLQDRGAITTTITTTQPTTTTNNNNCVFEAADANALPYADATFDVVVCHQLLQHVADPVGILREMRRVAKPGGVVAAREADYRSFAWFPEPAGLERWLGWYRAVARQCGGQPDAGRYVQQWAKQAGFAKESLRLSWSSWLYTGEAARKFGESWEGRALHSDFAREFVARGVGRRAELEEISATWRAWSTAEDNFIVIPNGEILYHVPATS